MTRHDPIAKWAELRELGHSLDRAGWLAPDAAIARVRAFLAGEKPPPSRKVLRGAFTYANESGNPRLVVETAIRLGDERVFEDAYVYGQVAVARRALGLLDRDAWQAFLSSPLGPRP